MAETEQVNSSRHAARRTVGRQAPAPMPTQDAPLGGSGTRRLIGPLDESGAPAFSMEPLAQGAEQPKRIEEQIRVRAYERFIARQGRPGSAEVDWLEAEREVRSSLWKTKGQFGSSPPPAI